MMGTIGAVLQVAALLGGVVWPFLFPYSFAKLICAMQAEAKGRGSEPSAECEASREEGELGTGWWVFFSGLSLLMLLLLAGTLLKG